LIILSIANCSCYNEWQLRTNEAVSHGIIRQDTCFITTSIKRRNGDHTKGRARLSNVILNAIPNDKHFLKKTTLGTNDLTGYLSSQKSTILSSSIVENPTSDSFPLYLRLDEVKRSTITTLKEVEWQDLAVVVCYMCNSLALGTYVVDFDDYAKYNIIS
jgi:hypothetical protein